MRLDDFLSRGNILPGVRVTGRQAASYRCAARISETRPSRLARLPENIGMLEGVVEAVMIECENALRRDCSRYIRWVRAQTAGHARRGWIPRELGPGDRLSQSIPAFGRVVISFRSLGRSTSTCRTE